jgi:hypothetical protein
MQESEQFALWIASATLRAGDQEVAALTLDELAREAGKTGDLEKGLSAMRQFDKRGGDFGAEIIGPLLIPILIEAGKQLWSSYLKKVTDRAAGQMADLTVDGIKAFVRRQWKDSGDSAEVEYEKLLRAAAAKQGLPQAQTDELVATLRLQRVKDEIVVS